MRLSPANRAACILVVALVASHLPVSAADARRAVTTDDTRFHERAAVLWRAPDDIRTRNLFYGPGGRGHAPHDHFAFVEEDLGGSTPKFLVVDAQGVKWKIKLGEQARPEVVATRLVWAVGYTAEEDYFLRDAYVSGMPVHLHRGQHLVGADGSMHNVRVKREPVDRKKVGEWKWDDNPFSGTPQLNGLRVLMAVINNWDLKDDNNACYESTNRSAPPGPVTCEVSDLGASFGSSGLERTNAASEGNLDAYRRSPFITHTRRDDVDFAVPRRAAWIVLANPRQFFPRLGLRWIGRHIPRQDARWMGGLLARLSPAQLRDAFRAVAYRPDEIDGFTTVVRSRIAELNGL